MRILLTGATGFLGSNLLRSLQVDGHEVVAVVRGSSSLAALPPATRVIRDEGATADLIASVAAFCPDVAVHMASKFVAAHEPADIEPLIEANLLFGCRLAEALVRAGCFRLVNIGTGWQHVAGDAYEPVSLYAATKQAFEDLLTYYASAAGLSVVTLKLSDTYGPDDPRPKLIALLRRAAVSGETLSMSPGEQRLNLTHVRDVVAAVKVAIARVLAADPGAVGSFAVRGPEILSLRELVRLVEGLAGRGIDVRWGARPYRAREVMEPWLGPLLPGWEARTSLVDGLREMMGVANV